MCYEYLMTEWAIDTFSLHCLRYQEEKPPFHHSHHIPHLPPHLTYSMRTFITRPLSQVSQQIRSGFIRLENHFTFGVFKFREPLCFLCLFIDIRDIMGFIQVDYHFIPTLWKVAMFLRSFFSRFCFLAKDFHLLLGHYMSHRGYLLLLNSWIKYFLSHTD